MNYAPQLLNYLSSTQDFTEVILAPKASPMERTGNVLKKVMDVTFSPEDIRDTLIALRSHTPVALGPLGREGFFSFGIPNIGRFRVAYITQRGSYVVSITRVPFDIPDPETILENPGDISTLKNSILESSGGIIAIIGISQIKNNLLAYSVIKRINQEEQKVIYIIERPISYLIKHGNSIIIQREVGIDVDNFEEGIKDAMLINPDIIYVSDVNTKEDMIALMHIAELSIPVLISIAISDENALIRMLELNLKEDFKEFTKVMSKIIKVSHSPNAKMTISISDTKHLVEKIH